MTWETALDRANKTIARTFSVPATLNGVNIFVVMDYNIQIIHENQVVEFRSVATIANSVSPKAGDVLVITSTGDTYRIDAPYSTYNVRAVDDGFFKQYLLR